MISKKSDKVVVNIEIGSKSEPKEKKEWYKSCLGMIVAFLIWPIFIVWYVWERTNWDKKVKWGITAAVVLLLIIVGFGMSNTPTTTTTLPKNTINPTEQPAANNTPATPETPTPAPVEKSYQPVFTFSGNGAKKSEPFIIAGDRFKIKYNCSGDLCQAFLYKVGSSIMSELIMNNAGAINDETIIYGSGEYYIDSNSIGSYTMTVEDYK